MGSFCVALPRPFLRCGRRTHLWLVLWLVLWLLPVSAGCTLLQRVAVDAIASSLTAGSVFTADEDPELIREAVPFGLKTYESLLAVSPRNRDLLLSAASGFASYAYLLQQQADLIDASDFAHAQRLRVRAKHLYLRGRDYALRGLALEHPRLSESLARDPTAALATTRKKDAPFLYWAGVSWAAALSTAKDDPLLIAELAIAAALVAHVLVLDEGFESGAAHEFFVAYEGSRPGGDRAEARAHYTRALALTHDTKASLHLALAEGVSVQQQNLNEFESLLAKAKAVDPDAVPEWRVANVLARQRAEWLSSRIPDLFIETGVN